MTAAVAAFADSNQGTLLAAVCDRWGVDPAAGFADDVLAFQFRRALMEKHPEPLTLETPEPSFEEKYG